jgi:small subunit ribosomal protein S17
MSEAKNIGLEVKGPDRSCQDSDCPFHGSLKVRGKLLSGRVVSVSAKNLAVVQRESFQYNKKYMRYMKKRNKIHAHLPPCFELSVGDTVSIAECRPISKTVSFVVVQRVPLAAAAPA